MKEKAIKKKKQNAFSLLKAGVPNQSKDAAVATLSVSSRLGALAHLIAVKVLFSFAPKKRNRTLKRVLANERLISQAAKLITFKRGLLRLMLMVLKKLLFSTGISELKARRRWLTYLLLNE